jgi:hypothetical protein
MKIIDMMEYNFENQKNKMPIHTEIGKKLISNGKINDMSAAWLSCSDEVGALKIAQNYYLNKDNYKTEDYTESRRMIA